MEKVRPWCGQPSDRGRLKNRTELNTDKPQLNIIASCSRKRSDGPHRSRHTYTHLRPRAVVCDEHVHVTPLRGRS